MKIRCPSAIAHQTRVPFLLLAGTVAATGLTGSIAAPFTGSLAGGAPAVSTGAGHLTGILPTSLSLVRHFRRLEALIYWMELI